MKTLRVLFLAVLAMALMVSGAFAAATELKATDITIKADGKTLTSLSMDVTSPDVSSQVVSFDFSEYVTKGYTVSFDNTNSEVTATSTDKGVWTVTFKPTASTKAGKFAFTFSLVSTDEETTTEETTTEIKVASIDVSSTDVKLSSDKKTGTVTVTVTLNTSSDTAPTLNVENSSRDVVTHSLEIFAATATPSKTWTAALTLTAVKSGDATITLSSGDVTKNVTVKVTSGDATSTASSTFEERILRQSYAAAAGEAEYTLTFTFNYKIDTTSKTTTTSPDIALAEVSSLQEKTVTLYVSGDAKTFPVKLVVSPDYENADFSFDVDPAPSAWKFSVSGGTTSTKSGDNYAIPYTLTFTPSETKSQDKTYYTMTAYIVGSADISSSMKFYVEVLVSSDTTSGETTPEVSDAELAMEDPEVGTEELMQGGKTTVTITATPQAALGTYTFDYDDADDVFTITAGDEKQVSSVTGNAVEFTVQAGIEAEVGTHVVTFYVVSGDQEVSADVTFTVSALDLSDMDDAEKAQYIKDNPAPAPQDLTSAAQKEANRQAFEAGTGEAKFKFQSEWPVKTTGWRLRFMRGTVRFVLLDFMRWLFGGQYYYNEASVMAALSIAASADNNSDAITVSVEDETTAEYTVDVEKTAKGLNNGEEFAVTPAIIPEAYADVTGVDDADKESAGESVGTMKGTKASGGDEQGGGEQGGGDDGKETIDNLLGGTSGGCDAGFGALALALAATLFLGKKRS